MALAPVGGSRIFFFKATSLEFNGSNWVSSGRALAPSTDATRNVLKLGSLSENPPVSHPLVILKSAARCNHVVCSAVPESSTPTVSADAKEEKAEKKPAAAKPKPAKAPAKALPQMMEEDIIPSLKSTLEAQDDISDLELAFKDNTLEGSFVQKDQTYCFWALFPDGALTGAKGFSLASYGSEVSTVEPFLVDEKKITPRHVVFWIEKRLAAQGIIPVWEK